MAEEKTITKIDDDHVAVITTTETEKIFKKSDLEAKKIEITEHLQKDTAEIDELLAAFN